MTRKILRAPARNTVKGSLDDDEYDALLRFKDKFDIESEAAALRRIVRLCLFGMVGTLPASLSTVSANSDQKGPRISA